jgi:hypothetical protein
MQNSYIRAVSALLLSSALLIAGDVTRNWQTGKVTETGNGIQQSGPNPTTNVVRTDDVKVWSVDAGDRVYQVTQVRRMGGGTAIRWHYGKAAPLNVGESVTFAVEGNDFFAKDSSGKEWKLHVQHVAMK